MSGVRRFDCYPSDFLNGVIGMNADQIAAYTIIMMMQYDSGEAVRYEGREREIAIRSGLPQGRLAKAVSELVRLGKIELQDGALFNRRTCKELEKIYERFEKNRENSEKGGEANKKNFPQKTKEINGDDKPTGYPTGYPKDSPNLQHYNSPADNPSAIKKGSEAIASGAALPTPPDEPTPLDEDPKTVLFSSGLDWLAKEADKPRDKMRPLLGKMLRDMGGDAHAAALLGILRDCKRERKADPIGWIQQMIAGRKSARDGPSLPKRNPNIEALEILTRRDREHTNSNSKFQGVTIEADPTRPGVSQSNCVVPVENGSELEGRAFPYPAEWAVGR